MTTTIYTTDFKFPGQKNVYHGKVRDVYDMGNKLVVVTGGTLAAGEYLYTLYVNGQKIDTKKMTLTH